MAAEVIPVGTFRFPGEQAGKGSAPQQPDFLRFFDEIRRIQDLDLDTLFQRNLRALIPQIDIGFNQGASRLGESLGARGLGFGGVASGANQSLANLLGVSRGQATLESLLQAEQQRQSGIGNALNFFAQLFGIRQGQALLSQGAEQIRAGERASQRSSRTEFVKSLIQGAADVGSAFASR